MSYDKHLSEIDLALSEGYDYDKVGDSAVRKAAQACAEITSQEVEKECIGFAEWIVTSGYSKSSIGWYNVTFGRSEVYTTKQLFNLYKKK